MKSFHVAKENFHPEIRQPEEWEKIRKTISLIKG